MNDLYNSLKILICQHLFDILNKSEVIKVLNYTFNINEEEYNMLLKLSR